MRPQAAEDGNAQSCSQRAQKTAECSSVSAGRDDRVATLVVGSAPRALGSDKLSNVSTDEQARRERAARRAEVMVLHKGRIGEPEVDFTPVRGAAAISLATRLTMESFSMARLDSIPSSRNELPIRFVPRTRA